VIADPPSLTGAFQVITALVFPRVATTEEGALATVGVTAAALEAAPSEARTILAMTNLAMRRCPVLILDAQFFDASLTQDNNLETSTQMHYQHSDFALDKAFSEARNV
jgi:hypothetical protein